ncbi:CATRA system-associated protein [Nonomuraea typhae]|uniref:CATRA system-associated protein n=1 Tax=Nonomuraea typhae TaxID=2603600 RepID=A0ABW7ZAQ6_9ACTN
MEDDVRDDALDLLAEVLVWRLAGDRWRAVERALDGLAAAGGDTDAFREVLHDLELAGPARAVRIEDVAVLPVPEPVRERINQLVHTLEGPGRAEDDPE